jgi:hypothetical protein
MSKRKILAKGVREFKIDAERLAQNWRACGYSVRTFKRTVRAGGAAISVYAVVAYEKPEPLQNYMDRLSAEDEERETNGLADEVTA